MIFSFGFVCHPVQRVSIVSSSVVHSDSVGSFLMSGPYLLFAASAPWGKKMNQVNLVSCHFQFDGLACEPNSRMLAPAPVPCPLAILGMMGTDMVVPFPSRTSLLMHMTCVIILTKNSCAMDTF